VYLLDVVAVGAAGALQPASEAGAEATGLSINLFWVIVGALNFLFFLALIWRFAFNPLADILAQRKARIEQGLADAEQARKDRDSAAAERDRVIGEPARAMLSSPPPEAAQDVRERTWRPREELGKMRERAAEIEARLTTWRSCEPVATLT
jgi:F-type H+-transporting ATPase subunit b